MLLIAYTAVSTVTTPLLFGLRYRNAAPIHLHAPTCRLLTRDSRVDMIYLLLCVADGLLLNKCIHAWHSLAWQAGESEIGGFCGAPPAKNGRPISTSTDSTSLNSEVRCREKENNDKSSRQTAANHITATAMYANESSAFAVKSGTPIIPAHVCDISKPSVSRLQFFANIVKRCIKDYTFATKSYQGIISQLLI
jgi:hypothetical protein